ncbi:hypothetical protein ACFS3C_12795 [Azotobacter vinelandii]
MTHRLPTSGNIVISCASVSIIGEPDICSAISTSTIFPSLAYAGRATASYPGAFPPVRIREIDEVLAERHMPWPARAHFLERNFRHYRERGENPEEAILLDGSVLDNKPITACVEAIRTHSAFREVDRRLVFVDPHPGIGKAAPGAGVPGFFSPPCGEHSRTFRGTTRCITNWRPSAATTYRPGV